jgi:hypothetical protein
LVAAEGQVAPDMVTVVGAAPRGRPGGAHLGHGGKEADRPPGPRRAPTGEGLDQFASRDVDVQIDLVVGQRRDSDAGEMPLLAGAGEYLGEVVELVEAGWRDVDVVRTGCPEAAFTVG